VAFSTDEGETWQQLKLNLPTVAVHDLRVKNNDLVVGTHGRSIWILDDLSPLREMSPQIAQAGIHLFSTPPAIRWGRHSSFHGKGIGDNPPYGAIINYYLKEKPKTTITLEVRDAQGTLVNSFTSKPQKKKAGDGPKMSEVEEHPDQSAKAEEEEEVPEDDPDAPFERVKKTVLTTEAGVNRVSWDLRYKGADKIKGAKVDAGAPEQGPLVNPGTYTLKLTVGGKVATNSAVVLLDPRSHASAADLDEQLRLALRIRDDLSHLSRMVTQIRSIRKQLADREDLLKGNSKATALRSPARELIRKLSALEEKLHNPKAQVTYDILAMKGGAKLCSQLCTLFEDAKEPGPVTQGARERYAELSRELEQHAGEFETLCAGDLAKLNELAKSLAIPNVIVGGTQQISKKPAN
jgi:hypothetical protein